MNKKLVLQAVSLVFLAFAALFFYGQTVEDHIRQGDAFYAQFDDAKALEKYNLAVQADPNNYEALWKLSRACFDVGDLTNTKEPGGLAKQRKLFKDAQSYARQAVRVNPNDTWGHFYLSAAKGKYVLTQGKKEQVNASKTIKAEIEKAIELDPNNDLAYLALGMWHRTMAEIGGAQRFFGGLLFGSIPKGTFEESEKMLLKAIELKPDYANHHLELGRTYVAMKKYDLAKQEFQKALDLPVMTSKCQADKKDAQAELDELKKKGR